MKELFYCKMGEYEMKVIDEDRYYKALIFKSGETIGKFICTEVIYNSVTYFIEKFIEIII